MREKEEGGRGIFPNSRPAEPRENEQIARWKSAISWQSCQYFLARPKNYLTYLFK